VPQIHGQTVAVANQLYPLLIAPLYGALSTPDAFRAAHVLNAVVMTSAVFPAYLLARQLVGRVWAFALAALTVVTPWIVLTGVLMSESAAYPVFLWAMLAFHRAVVRPSAGRDLLAAVALGAAILARSQLAALVLVLPLAIAAHELLGARRGVRGMRAVRRMRATLGTGGRLIVARHRVLWGVYLGAAALAAAIWLGGYPLFGAYTPTVEEGSVLPAGVWLSALRHLDLVAIGCGIVPLLLGGGSLLAAAGGRIQREREAFALLAGSTIVALALETASFDLRFGGPDVIRDRYLFYVVPLLLVASAAALTEERRRSVALGVGVVTAVVAASAHGLTFATFPGVSIDSPASVVNEALIDQSGALATGTFVAVGVVLLGAVLAIATVIAPRRPTAIVLFTALATFSLVVVYTELDRILAGTGLSGRPLAKSPGVVLDWIDSVVPEGETASIVSFPLSTAWGVSAIQWWDVEFWNRSITRSYVAEDGHFAYTGFPQREIRIDPVTGVLAGTERAPRFVVMAPGDPRFGLAGERRAENVGLRVIDAERPYRAVWSTAGLRTDGWTRPGVPDIVRIHPRPGARPELAQLAIRIAAPESTPAEYRVTAGTASRSGTLEAGTATDEPLLACVGPRSPAVAIVTSPTAASVDGPPLGPDPEPTRLVGVHVGPVEVEWTGRPCDG
jgi:hypothetical protein